MRLGEAGARTLAKRVKQASASETNARKSNNLRRKNRADDSSSREGKLALIPLVAGFGMVAMGVVSAQIILNEEEEGNGDAANIPAFQEGVRPIQDVESIEAYGHYSATFTSSRAECAEDSFGKIIELFKDGYNAKRSTKAEALSYLTSLSVRSQFTPSPQGSLEGSCFMTIIANHDLNSNNLDEIPVTITYNENNKNGRANRTINKSLLSSDNQQSL